MDDLLAEVAESIPPVWPLKDYVAVNPYLGLTQRPFLEARSFLRLFSDCETLMPLEYFAQHTDGFLIAEADLQLRGPGEIFGVRQSGLPELRIANLWRDRDLMEAGRKLMEKLVVGPAQLDEPLRTLYTYLERVAQDQAVNLGGG